MLNIKELRSVEFGDLQVSMTMCQICSYIVSSLLSLLLLRYPNVKILTLNADFGCVNPRTPSPPSSPMSPSPPDLVFSRISHQTYSDDLKFCLTCKWKNLASNDPRNTLFPITPPKQVR